MHRRLSLVTCAAIIVAMAGLAFAQAPKAKPAAKAQGKAATAAKPGTYAHFETSMGNFSVRLWPDKAPQTVANFVGLVEGTVDTITGRHGVKAKPFYNGLQFHRVVPGFMIQGGRSAGYTIPDEFDPKFKFNRPGILAMANAGNPHSASSQFFITVAPYPSLNGKYTPFGEVTAGLDLVKKISTVKRSGESPIEPVVIRTVKIEKVK